MNAETFRRFYADSAPALRSYLRFRLKNASLADDLLQESYLRLYRADPVMLPTAQLRSYLYRTANSVIADHYRHARREPATVPIDGHHGLEMRDRASAAEPELPQDIGRVFNQIGDRDRELLWLAYVEGFSHREIAPMIGVREKSVRVMLLRERMARVLTDHGLGPEEAA